MPLFTTVKNTLLNECHIVYWSSLGGKLDNHCNIGLSSSLGSSTGTTAAAAIVGMINCKLPDPAEGTHVARNRRNLENSMKWSIGLEVDW